MRWATDVSWENGKLSFIYGKMFSVISNPLPLCKNSNKRKKTQKNCQTNFREKIQNISKWWTQRLDGNVNLSKIGITFRLAIQRQKKFKRVKKNKKNGCSNNNKFIEPPPKRIECQWSSPRFLSRLVNSKVDEINFSVFTMSLMIS